MLMLRRYKLVNVCQHVSREQELQPGVVAIVGPNGSGKTNLMQLVRASVTNTYHSLAGNKEDNIYRLAAKDAPSYIETQWQVAGGDMLIRRGFQNSDSGLWLNGEQLAGNKARDITAKAIELIGTTPKVFDEFMFADVRRLTTIATGTKEERVSLIQPLCGLERIEAIDRQLRTAEVANAAVIGSFDQAELDDHRYRWSQLRDRIREYSRTYAEREVDLPDQKQIAAAQRRIAEYEARLRDRDELEKARDRLRKATAELTPAEAEVVEATEAEAAAGKLAMAAATASADHAAAVEKWRAAKQYIETKERLEAELSEPPPVRPKAGKFTHTLSEVREQISIETYRRAQAEEALQRAQDSDEEVQTCQHCLNEYQITEQYLEHLEAEVQGATEAIQQWKDIEEKLVSHELRVQEYKTKKQAYDWSIKVATEQLARLEAKPVRLAGSKPKSPEVPFSRQAADANAAHTKAKQRLQEANHRATTLLARKEHAEQDIERYEQRLSETTAASKADINKLRKTVDTYHEMVSELSQLETELAKATGEAAVIQRVIRKLLSERRMLKAKAGWLEVLGRSRAVLKRDRLPARVIADTLYRTADYLNQYLNTLGATFTAIPSPDEHSFDIRHLDGTREPANRLSSGQAVLFGVSFWLARAEVFRGQLPFFWFDEPVANLDDEYTTASAEWLGRLGQEMVRVGRQGIIITHDYAITRKATQVVQL